MKYCGERVMEALRTLVQALASVGPHGCSVSSGGLSLGGRLLHLAAGRDLQIGEQQNDLLLRGIVGYDKKWIVQKVFLTEAAISAAEVLGEPIRYALDAARLAGRQAAPAQSLNITILAFACWIVSDNGDLCCYGMARWIWHSYQFFYISRSKPPCFFFPRIYGYDRSVSKEYRPAPLLPVDYGARVGSDSYQIFINLPTGNSILVWVNVLDSVEVLRDSLASCVGYPASVFYLVHVGKPMQDSLNLSDYQISKNCSISLLLRLRGGDDGKQSGSIPSHKGTGPSSYKDAAQSNGPRTGATSTVQPSPYIVEKLESTPVLEIKNE